MAKISDELAFPIPCPECGHEISKTLAELKDNPTIICPACSAQIEVTSDAATTEAADKLEEIDRLIEGFGKKP